MLSYNGRIAAISLLLVLLLSPFSSPTLAQGGIKVSPAKIDLVIGKGQTAEEVISVENQGDRLARIRVYAMDFSIDKESDFAFNEPGHESYSCARWLTIDEAEFDLNPGESKGVKVTVSVPTEVEPGGHYAALFFETAPLEAPPGVSVTIAGRIPSLFYLTIPGITEADVFSDAEIASLLLPGWVEKGSVEMGVVVRNTGNVHLTIAAKAYFSGFRGEKIGELDLGQMVILPRSERIMKGSWEKTPLFSKVKASVVIGYFDQQGELVNKTKTADFWVIPWKLVLIIVVALGLLILLIWRLRKRYRLRIERKQGNFET
jgi:P pilus assembly chaperone PapD